VDNLQSKSELKLLHEAAARAADVHEGKLVVFNLFLNKTWFKAINQWCKKSLNQKGLKKESYLQFMAYIGLKVPMSIVSLNAINDYWRTEMFLHQQDFTKVMSRDSFKRSRANVYNSAKIVMPIGTSALDENFAHPKARTRAIRYNPEKPDKNAIRFHAVVSSYDTCLHSVMDNRTGNTTPESAPVAYC
jgi:hypothetical protein